MLDGPRANRSSLGYHNPAPYRSTMGHSQVLPQKPLPFTRPMNRSLCRGWAFHRPRFTSKWGLTPRRQIPSLRIRLGRRVRGSVSAACVVKSPRCFSAGSHDSFPLARNGQGEPLPLIPAKPEQRATALRTRSVQFGELDVGDVADGAVHTIARCG
jgi:hypothetical protein